MADAPDKPKPNVTDRAQAAQREREARLAGALRANLRRRKAPERGDAKPETSEKDRDPNG